MKGRDTLRAVIALAIASAAGIVGLLLAGEAWDWALLAMAALPLAVGLWCWRRESAHARRPAPPVRDRRQPTVPRRDRS